MHVVPPGVYVRHTGSERGRGVYAARSYADGELIEACPVVLFYVPFAAVPDEVRKLLFNWGALSGTGSRHGLALGYGSLYNHDNPSNLRYEADHERGLLRFVAVRAIDRDEELTVNYNAAGGGFESSADTWFDRMNVAPLAGS